MKKKKTALQIYKSKLKGKRKRGTYKSKILTKADLEIKFEAYKAQNEGFGPSMTFQLFAEKTAKKQITTDKLYNTYLKTYQKKKLESQKSGVSISSPLTKDSFVSIYEATKNDYLKSIEEGNRATVGAITRDIVNAQVEWGMSSKSASQAAKAAREAGLDVSYKDLRLGNEKAKEFWEMIKKERKDLISKGLTSKESSLSISQQYFGSE